MIGLDVIVVCATDPHPSDYTPNGYKKLLAGDINGIWLLCSLSANAPYAVPLHVLADITGSATCGAVEGGCRRGGELASFPPG